LTIGCCDSSDDCLVGIHCLPQDWWKCDTRLSLLEFTPTHQQGAPFESYAETACDAM
jgi:hypothetical protein